MESSKAGKRRRYGAELKAQILAECEAPGASVAKVALSHGINANVVHSWRRHVRAGVVQKHASGCEFVAVPLVGSAPMMRVSETVQLELRRGAIAVTVSWPVSALGELAHFTREVLR